MELQKRGLTIFFVDGSKLHVTFPAQTENEHAALLKIEEVLKQRQIIVNIEGAILVIPFDNIKYIQAFPAPVRMPRGSILGATIQE